MNFAGIVHSFMLFGYRIGKLAMEKLGVEREKDRGFFVFPEIGFGHTTTYCDVHRINAQWHCYVFSSISYGREKLIIFKTALPILIVATLLSPFGDRTGQYLPREILLWIFIGFLIFAGSIMLFYKAQIKTAETTARKMIMAGIGAGRRRNTWADSLEWVV